MQVGDTHVLAPIPINKMVNRHQSVRASMLRWKKETGNKGAKFTLEYTESKHMYITRKA